MLLLDSEKLSWKILIGIMTFKITTVSSSRSEGGEIESGEEPCNDKEIAIVDLFCLTQT